jgi:pimeloyl-ACP methyl ester carboxylesterase
MSAKLLSAILAMDAYNRGYNQAIFGLPNDPGTQIGNATIAIDSDDSSQDQADGFYGIAYQWGSDVVISYRGTDSILGTGTIGSDLLNGWLIGAGVMAPQAADAEAFYDAAVNKANATTTTSVAGGTVNNVLLVGHSLGGGLAGYIAALTGDSATIFDSMPYAAAAVYKLRRVSQIGCSGSIDSKAAC